MISKEDLEVLKSPHSFNAETIKDTLEKAFPLANAVNFSDEFLSLSFGIDRMKLEINWVKFMREDFGNFNVYDKMDYIRFIEKHFKYPLLPTEEERTLFEIEFGVSYPIEAYRGDL